MFMYQSFLNLINNVINFKMKQKNKITKQIKCTNQNLEKIIKLSQNTTNNMPNRSLDLLCSGEDKCIILEERNFTDNAISQPQKIDEFSTRTKSTKNIESSLLNTQTKSSKSPDKILKNSVLNNQALTPKSMLKTNPNLLCSLKYNKTSSNLKLNKTVSRENKHLRESFTKSGKNFSHDNGK